MTGIDSEMFERAVESQRRRRHRDLLVSGAVGILLLTPVGFVIARLVGVPASMRSVAAPLLAMATIGLAYGTVKAAQWVSANVLMSFLQPGGQVRTQPLHSRAQALAAAGRLDDATREFDAARGDTDDVASLRAEAELNTRPNGDPRRAEQLLLRVRRAPDAGAHDELYASHRLIDLYLGPLNDRGRAMVELRRMADRFPDTADGRGALAALKQHKDEQRA